MTVSNVMPVAAPGRPSESRRESAATGGEDFASALRRLLEPQSPDGGTSDQAPGAAAADPAAPTGEQPPQTSLPATSALVGPDMATAGAMTTVPGELADQAVVDVAPGETGTAAVPESATTVSVVAATGAIAGTQAAGTTGAPAAAPVGAEPAPTTQPTVAQTAMPDGAEAQIPQELVSSQRTQTTGPMTAAVSASAAIHREADAVQPAPIGTAGVEVAPAANVGSTGQSATSTTGAPTPVTGSAVTGQVFPHVTSLVSRGDGRHSITLRLHPADLGEVRVTVTVKNGAVDVTLAAGVEARQALRSGSGELRSLLELAGAATGNVVIRDLPGTSAATPSSALPAAAGDPHGTGASADADARAGADPDGRREPGDRARDETPQHGMSGRLDGGGTDPIPQTTRDAGTPTSLDLTL